MNLAGIDVGTGSVKCCVYREDGEMIASARESYHYADSDSGYCLDADQVWESTKRVLKKAARDCQGRIAGLSIASIGESCVLLDQDDRVLAPSILYNDKRGMQESLAFIDRFGGQKIAGTTGVCANGTHSLEKLMWIRQHEPYFARAKKIFLYEDFIGYRLTGERVISYSLASRTMGLNIEKRSWWEEAFAFAGVSPEQMSRPAPSGSPVGTIKKGLAEELGLPEDLRVFVGGHDQSCCTLGAGMIREDIGVNVSGSGDTLSFFLNEPMGPEKMLRGDYCCVPFTVDGKYITYGLCAMSGTMLRWYGDTFWGQADSKFYSGMEDLVPGCETDVIVFPAFSASGNPDSCLDASGAVEGLTLKTTAEQIYKAFLEGIAFQLKMNQEILDRKTACLRVTGGGSASDAWNQIKADIFGMEVETLDNTQTGTAGCAILAGIGLGVYAGFEEAASNFVHVKKTCFPDTSKSSYYEEKYSRFLTFYREQIRKCREK